MVRSRPKPLAPRRFAVDCSSTGATKGRRGTTANKATRRQSDQGHDADGRPPGDDQQQQREHSRKGCLPEIAGEVIDAQWPACGAAIGVGHQNRGARMLNARADAGEHQASAQPRKSKRQRHDQIARCRDQGCQRQCGTWAQPGDQPAARDLQAAHRAVVERPNHRETGIRQPEV